MQKAQTRYLFRRNDVFYFRRMIPAERRMEFKNKREWVHSLATKCKNEALAKLAEYARYYDNVLSFTSDVCETLTAPRLKERALQLNVPYHHVDAVATAPVEQSIAMIGAGLEAFSSIATPDPVTIATVSGIAEPPAVTMRQALEQFQNDSADMWMTLSHREKQKKWNKYKEAVTNFETVMGADVDVMKLTMKEVYEYRNKLLNRVNSDNKAESIKVDTVRKKLMWLRVIVRHVYELDGRKDSPFENLRPIKGIGDEEKRRVITEPEVVAVRKHFEEVGANDELVAIMAVIENTGATAKEIVMLTKDDIHLEAEIPYIEIKPNEHRSMLKTDNRIRKVPVVGIAFDALRRFPDGFPRYRRDNGSEALSGAANQLIQKVADGATSYSYRHRLAKLMKAGYVEDGEQKHIQDSLKNSIMGHATEGMSDYYGDEYPLEVKLSVLKAVLPEVAYRTKL